MEKRKITTKQIAFAGILAAVYAVVTILTAPFAYGGVQFRIAEALMVLCCFTPTASFGLVIGCIVANLFSTVSALDFVVGSAATLIACLVTQRLRHPLLLPLPAILANGIIVGAEIAFFTEGSAFLAAFGLNALSVAAGEAAVLYILGVPLYLFLRKSPLGAKLRAM